MAPGEYQLLPHRFAPGRQRTWKLTAQQFSSMKRTPCRDREELRALLNSGHTRAGAVVIRTSGDDHEARMFSTWCPKTVALIGEMPPTLGDRAVEIRMRRRRQDEAVERLRLDRLGDLESLRRRCAR